MEQGYDLLQVLKAINPSLLSYQEWVDVGMALKEEGYDVAVWDEWSAQDAPRYHKNECYRKWQTFRGTGTPVTGGTIVQLAREQGWEPEVEPGHEIGWGDVISGYRDELQVVNPAWVENREIEEPGDDWDPAADLVTYLETLFEPGENVGYVTKTWEDENGKHVPTKGNCDRTASELIKAIHKYKTDIGAALGDYNPAAGAWIRFNPLDGKGVKNENVTEFRYALVESDTMEIEKQNAILREMELPIACLVHSGKKSLHAIVRIDAIDYKEYRKRVDYLYDVCRKNGLQIDPQNRNPSRLSRMPGVMRNGHKQFLIDTNIGKSCWQEWVDWIESVNDDLPDPEGLSGLLDNLPELAPCLIDGVLRQGHKMLLAGPSKAGKSFLQIELCISIAEGVKWLGWQCAQGKVLYVNLELDRASCLHRFADVYQAMGLRPVSASNIDVWNLRGKSVPMDKLTPKLIRRAAKKGYIAIVIDPIYKVITGDENSADQMAAFCNQFDKICTDLNTAVIYCHHHSKGAQGGKRSMDRSSGSGVFARDPDALLDLSELPLNENLLTYLESKAACKAYTDFLDKNGIDYDDDLGPDDLQSPSQLRDYCDRIRHRFRLGNLDAEVSAARESARKTTAWRLEGTLREFAAFEPANLWFEYPIHKIDDSGILSDVKVEGAIPKKKTKAEKIKDVSAAHEEKLETAFAIYEDENKGRVRPKLIADYYGISVQTVRNWIDNSSGFERDGGVCVRIKN